MTDFQGLMMVNAREENLPSNIEQAIRDIGIPHVFYMVEEWSKRTPVTAIIHFSGEASGFRGKIMCDFFQKVADRFGEVDVVRFEADYEDCSDITAIYTVGKEIFHR